MKISLDSNVFREVDFIDWLQVNRDRFATSISIIVLLETLHWYKLKGLNNSEFNKDLSKFNPVYQELSISDIDSITDDAINSKLKFKHHAREIIIGSHALKKDSTLITLNVKHF